MYSRIQEMSPNSYQRLAISHPFIAGGSFINIFDDETRLIRAQTASLLRRVHDPVPRVSRFSWPLEVTSRVSPDLFLVFREKVTTNKKFCLSHNVTVIAPAINSTGCLKKYERRNSSLVSKLPLPVATPRSAILSCNPYRIE
ncbi:hypothetical protein NQ317_004069 [Molorchus minor]|uniref:Uncharacterized protein n=1 Tax=Molorchus minor TaxID=1323400 RepID=A0ABQ9JPZ7_9CUCU|nr:hypothetical protein NQ317_004069 [Molorchus minor]